MDEFPELITQLEIPFADVNSLESLRDKVLAVRNPEETNKLIQEIKKREKNLKHNINSFIDIPILLSLLAHCYHVASTISESKRNISALHNITRAIEKFRVCDCEWNEAMACAYLGRLYYKIGKFGQSRIELGTAVHILKKLEEDCAEKGQYERLTKLRELLAKFDEWIKQAI